MELIGQDRITILFQPTTDVYSFFEFTDSSAPRYVLFKNIDFVYDDALSGDVSCGMIGPSQDNGRDKYYIAEDSSFTYVQHFASTAQVIVKRSNFTKFGAAKGPRCGGSTTCAGRPLVYSYGNTLFKNNYIADGFKGDANYEGHSHVHYNREYHHIYYVGEYIDAINQEAAKVGITLKPGNSTSNQRYQGVIGNIVRNTKSYGIDAGRNEMASLSDVVISDNRIINVGGNRGIEYRFSTADNLIERNFLSEIDAGVIALKPSTGSADCANFSGMKINDNVAGYLAGSDAGESFINAPSCNPPAYTQNGNVDNTLRHMPSDPTGWYNTTGYVDPGPFEYTPPSNTSISISGTGPSVTLTLSATDSGSGMGSSARFPFHEGGLMQFSNDGVTWSEVRPYNTTATWTLTGNTVYARFRDRDGNWSDPVSGTLGGGAPTCTSFTYSAWGACQPNNTQTRTVTSSSPTGCVGGNPVTTQSCTYVPGTFEVGDRVQVDTGDGSALNVRSTPNGTLVGQQSDGALGTVVGGPTQAGGYTWWQVNFDVVPDGWVVENYLTAYTNTLQGDVNGDGTVNIFDYNIILTNFGTTSCGVQGDTDSDCDVDIFDYNTVLTEFGMSV